MGGERRLLKCMSFNCSPMDFLIAPRHRWIYVAIFSVMAISAFEIFQNLNNLKVSSNLYLNLFLNLCKFNSQVVFVLCFYLSVSLSPLPPPSISLSLSLYFSLFASVIWPLFAIILISLLFFPLFGCVDAAIPLLGHVMGLIYSVLW